MDDLVVPLFFWKPPYVECMKSREVYNIDVEKGFTRVTREGK